MEWHTRLRQATRLSSPTCPPQLQRRRFQGRNETYRGLTPYEFADSRQNKKAQRCNGEQIFTKGHKAHKEQFGGPFTDHLSPSPITICVNLRSSAVVLPYLCAFAALREIF